MGDVRQLWIPGPAGRLESLLRIADEPRAVAIVAHPHPLHGGTMHNPVIFHADRELNRAGLHTMRFNFRGVGASDGTHDEGRGEVEDLAAAVGWLRGLAGDLPLIVVGFSFGSLCGLRAALDDERIVGLVAIGFPVRRYPIGDEVQRLGRPFAIVQASDDEFGTPEDVRRVVANSDPPVEILVVPDTTHLFPDRARDAAQRVVDGAGRVLTAARRARQRR